MNDVKEFVELIVRGESDLAKSPGAGIVVVRKFKNDWKILGLKLNGAYDLPKGKTDGGETPFQTAVRETYEESGIDKLKFTWGMESVSIKHLTFFIAETYQDAYIPKNPESGIYEHDSAEWLSFEKIRSLSYGYLVPIIDWAQSIVIK